MATLADFGIREVTDPGRIAAAENRLRDFSGSQSLTVEQTIAATREMDAEREPASVSTTAEILFFAACAGAIAYAGAKLFRQATSSEHSSTESFTQSSSRYTEPSQDEPRMGDSGQAAGSISTGISDRRRPELRPTR
jgi:hypothetical protein